MNELNLRKRKEMFKEADPFTQNLYASMEVAEFNHRLIEDYHITDRVNLVMIVGDIILGLNSLAQVSILVQDRLSLPPSQADMIAARIRDFLGPKMESAKSLEQENTQQNNEVIKPFDSVSESISNIHGYGAGLPKEDPVHSSKQEDVMSKPERNNPHTDENLPPWQK